MDMLQSLRDFVAWPVVFLWWVLVCALIGAAIGFICRDRPRLSITLSLIATFVYFVFLEGRSPTRAEEWVSSHPFASAAYLVGPFVGFFFAPAALAALFVGRLRRRRRGHISI
jgi:predicted branched-subunit amino acid permease